MNPIIKRVLLGLMGFTSALVAALSTMDGGASMTLAQIGNVPLVAWMMALTSGLAGSLGIKGEVSNKQLTSIAILFSVAILLAACATPEQKVIGDIATRNVVAQYIQAGKDIPKRRDEVSAALDSIESAMTLSMNSEDFVSLVEKQLSNKNMTPADKLLMTDILDLTRASVDIPKPEPGQIYEIAQRFIKQARFAVSLYDSTSNNAP